MMMIKRTILLLALTATAAHAIPIGRPNAAEHQWRVGGIAAFDNVKLSGKTNLLNKGELHSRIFLAEGVYGFTQGGEIVLRLGSSDDRYVTGATRDLGEKIDWGIGLRGILWDSYRDWRILGDAQYFTRPGRNSGIADLEITQWQLASSVEWHFSEYYPYAGLYYGSLHVNSNNEAIFPSLKTSGSLGVHLGLGYEPTIDWTFNLEGRFVGGSSVSGGVHYRF